MIDNTRKPWPNGYGKPLELVFGKKFQLPVFETCIKSMQLKEVELNNKILGKFVCLGQSI